MKCEKYWPESGVEEYGKMRVKHLGTETLADYTIRTLELQPVRNFKSVPHSCVTIFSLKK